MAWATKKQFAILTGNDKGKDIIQRLPQMSQDEFQKVFTDFLKSSPDVSADDVPEKAKESGKEPSSSQNNKQPIKNAAAEPVKKPETAKKGPEGLIQAFISAVEQYCSTADSIRGLDTNPDVNKAAEAVIKEEGLQDGKNSLMDALQGSIAYIKLCAKSDVEVIAR
jgi:hypothetical protein